MGVKVSAVHEYTSPVNSSTSEDYAMTGTMQIDTSTIDGNVEFVQPYSDSVSVSDKIINNSEKFRIKCLFYSKISAILCVLHFLLLHFFI